MGAEPLYFGAVPSMSKKTREPTRLSRRSFGRATLIAPSALVAAACGDDAAEDEALAVVELDALAVGDPVMFELEQGRTCFIVRLEGEAEHGVGPEQSIVAFSTLCPHMGCPIDPSAADPQTGHFGPCACHQSLFDLRKDGRMVRGRACANLARIELEVRGSTVFALRLARPSFGEPLREAHALTTVEAVLATQEMPS